jgi:hypothetical protein
MELLAEMVLPYWMILKDLFGMNSLVILREKIKLTSISLPMGMIIEEQSETFTN